MLNIAGEGVVNNGEIINLLTKFKIPRWNANGVKTHGKELYHMISKLRTDVAVLCKTRADVRQTFSRMWPRAKVEQVRPKTREGEPEKAGVAVVTEPVGEVQLLKLLKIAEDGKIELIKAVKMTLNGNTCIVGMSIGSQTSGKRLEEAMTNIKEERKNGR